jgi:hypothetical protein
MINHLSIIFIVINFYILTKCAIVQTRRVDNRKEICIENQFQTLSMNHLKVCYLNDIEHHSILVWFTIGKSLNDTFDFYRFILRSIDDLLSSNIIIETLTNFTKLVDFNNSLRIFNLDSGQYEVCIEFQSNFSAFIYQPRDGCISIQIGKFYHGSFKQCSIPLLITLASCIVLFFILGLVVQWAKVKHQKKQNDDDNNSKVRSRTLSTLSLKQQRDRLVRNFFHRHIDQPRPSRIRQWARNRAFRHRISPQEHEFEKPKSLQKWTKHLFTSIDQSLQTISHNKLPSLEPNLPTDNIYTISEKEHYQIPFRKISFHLSSSEKSMK